jgi:xanthine dehydrogenase accessory factor
MLVYPDGEIVGSVGGGEVEGRIIKEALEVMETGQARIVPYQLVDPQRGDPGVCGGSLEVFLEPLVPSTTLVVVGGGHVGQAVVHLANWLGYRVVLTDDRKEFCNPEVAPGAAAYYPSSLADLPDQIEFTPQTIVILVTRSMDIDVSGLPEILSQPYGYIGVISSQRRWTLTEEKLREEGVKEADLRNIHAPIGLDINAESPEEIAVSIMAEVIMVQRGGDGGSLSK